MAVVLPIGSLDAGGRRRSAVATSAGVLACGLAFVGTLALGPEAWGAAFGAVPAQIAGDAPPGTTWPPATLLTAVFVHGGWAHLFYNLVALWVFGAAIELRLGWKAFVALFVGGGALAIGAEVLASPGAVTPVVGASGGVAAVAGAFAVQFPRARVVVAAVFLTVPVRGWVALGAWAAVEALAQATGSSSGTAHVAHLTGFAIGAGASLTFLGDSEGAFEPDKFLMTAVHHPDYRPREPDST